MIKNNVFEMLNSGNRPDSNNGLTCFMSDISQYGEEEVRRFYQKELEEYPMLNEVFEIQKMFLKDPSSTIIPIIKISSDYSEQEKIDAIERVTIGRQPRNT